MAATLEGKSPFAMLSAYHQGNLVEVCNAFHIRFPNLRKTSELATAGHCIKRAQERKADEFRLHYFDNRKGVQQSVKVENTLYQGMNDNEFGPDFAIVELSQEIRRDWDEVVFEGEPAESGTDDYTIWAFEYRAPKDPDFASDPLRNRERAVFQKIACKGTPHRSPIFTMEWMEKADEEPAFGQKTRFSFSTKGVEKEQKLSLYLSRCPLKKGFSGALITDGNNHPVGLLHTGITTDTFRTLWTKALQGNFKKGAEETLGKRKDLSEGVFKFSVETKGTNTVFALEKDELFYGAGMFFNDWLSLDPKL